jgi:uncharacterized protein (TIGR00266 family)
MEFKIEGDDIQLLSVALNAGESVFAEPGSMVCMDEYVDYTSRLSNPNSSGAMSAVSSMFMRKISGEKSSLAEFKNVGAGNAKRSVSFAAPYPGKIIEIKLTERQPSVYCQKGAFLASDRGISISIALNRRIGAGLFSENGFILQKLKGNGIVFIHAGGFVKTIDLHQSVVTCDAGTVAGFTSGIDYDVKFVKNAKSWIFGGEGLALMTLKGTGKVFVQSNPVSRIADNLYGHSEAMRDDLKEITKQMKKVNKKKNPFD